MERLAAADGIARAKINLFLDVIGWQADGYHRIDGVMQSLELGDPVRVCFDPARSGIHLQVTGGRDIPVDSRNLAWRAAERFLTCSGLGGGVTVLLEKRGRQQRCSLCSALTQPACGRGCAPPVDAVLAGCGAWRGCGVLSRKPGRCHADRRHWDGADAGPAAARLHGSGCQCGGGGLHPVGLCGAGRAVWRLRCRSAGARGTVRRASVGAAGRESGACCGILLQHL